MPLRSDAETGSYDGPDGRVRKTTAHDFRRRADPSDPAGEFVHSSSPSGGRVGSQKIYAEKRVACGARPYVWSSPQAVISSPLLSCARSCLTAPGDYLRINSLDLVEGNLILGAIIEFRGTRRLMRRDLLRVLQRAAVLQIGSNSGCSKSMTAGGVVTVSDVKPNRWHPQ
jgi:hypothetical protein